MIETMRNTGLKEFIGFGTMSFPLSVPLSHVIVQRFNFLVGRLYSKRGKYSAPAMELFEADYTFGLPRASLLGPLP